MRKIILYFLCSLQSIFAQNGLTVFEKTLGKETATYFECINYYKKLANTYSTISFKTMGPTDAGYPLHLILISSNKNFNPIEWHKQGKVVIMINNGIHPGEPDGIDASMMLVRDLVTGKIMLPSNVVLGVIPVYNIGGCLNRNTSSRVNQDGPSSFGFRGNSQNLDLNRDFIKNDSKESSSFAEIFHFLNPDILIDNHVSDGADYQHTMTLLTTQKTKLGGPIGNFLNTTFEPALFKSMYSKNWPMCPYVNFETANPDNGWTAFYDAPRYSSGYAALFATMAFVPETHMLKPFNDRVKSTYALMTTFIETSSRFARDIKSKREQSIIEIKKQQKFVINWKSDTSKFDIINFMGYESAYKKSTVTGFNRLYYDRSKPFERQIKFYNSLLPEKVVYKPKAYLIPQGWVKVIELLKLNKVEMQIIDKDTVINVSAYKIDTYKTSTRVYEKHFKHTSVGLKSINQNIKFLKGDFIIYTNQVADRFLVETLEPEAEDSYFRWNFFDAILQQKEGYSDYRWEDVAAKFLEDHPDLRVKLEQRKIDDAKFAGSAAAQLDFVYKNSPYYEPAHLRYPVYRINY